MSISSSEKIDTRPRGLQLVLVPPHEALYQPDFYDSDIQLAKALSSLLDSSIALRPLLATYNNPRWQQARERNLKISRKWIRNLEFVSPRDKLNLLGKFDQQRANSVADEARIKSKKVNGFNPTFKTKNSETLVDKFDIRRVNPLTNSLSISYDTLGFGHISISNTAEPLEIASLTNRETLKNLYNSNMFESNKFRDFARHVLGNEYFDIAYKLFQLHAISTAKKTMGKGRSGGSINESIRVTEPEIALSFDFAELTQYILSLIVHSNRETVLKSKEHVQYMQLMSAKINSVTLQSDGLHILKTVETKLLLGESGFESWQLANQDVI